MKKDELFEKIKNSTKSFAQRYREYKNKCNEEIDE